MQKCESPQPCTWWKASVEKNWASHALQGTIYATVCVGLFMNVPCDDCHLMGNARC